MKPPVGRWGPGYAPPQRTIRDTRPPYEVVKHLAWRGACAPARNPVPNGQQVIRPLSMRGHHSHRLNGNARHTRSVSRRETPCGSPASGRRPGAWGNPGARSAASTPVLTSPHGTGGQLTLRNQGGRSLRLTFANADAVRIVVDVTLDRSHAAVPVVIDDHGHEAADRARN